MLLLGNEDVFTIKIKYFNTSEGSVKIIYGEDDEIEKDRKVEEVVFEFRKPSWKDIRKIMNLSSRNGNIDPIAFVEARITTLLRSWSLKDKEGKPLPIKEIVNVPPEVIFLLNKMIEDETGDMGKPETWGKE